MLTVKCSIHGEILQQVSERGKKSSTAHQYIPITWTECIAMQKKVREVMDAIPPEISNDIVTVRDEVNNWASSLKAPKDWDSGEAVSLKA